MRICIVTPTEATVHFNNEDELNNLNKQLSYKNTSIAHQIRLHKSRKWMKKKDPVGYKEQLADLESQLNNCLVYHNGKDWCIRPGSIIHIKGNIESITSKINHPEFKPLPWFKTPEFEPYPYQTKAINDLLQGYDGIPKHISLPTGAGKSHILLMLAKMMGLPTVVITPSKSIFKELLADFTDKLGKKYVGGYGDGKKDTKKLITIAIGKSLTTLKQGTPQYDFFKNKKAMLVDESHTFAAKELEKACHGVCSDVPYRFFVSATQTRNDGTEKLLQSIIGKCVLEMSLKEAIDQGYLCPLNFTIISTFSPSTKNKKEPIGCKREHFLYNNNIAEISAKIANASWNVKQESTVILVEELCQIAKLSKLLTVPFGYVHAGSKAEAQKWGLNKIELQDEVDKFNKGDYKVLIGTRAIYIGTNLYPVHNTINWVGGSSEIITKQGPMGRSTRVLSRSKYKEFHKPKLQCMIYDFRVKQQPILDKQLLKRANWYRESGGKIGYVK